MISNPALLCECGPDGVASVFPSVDAALAAASTQYRQMYWRYSGPRPPAMLIQVWDGARWVLSHNQYDVLRHLRGLG